MRLPDCSLEEETLYCLSIVRPKLEGPISEYWVMKMGDTWEWIRIQPEKQAHNRPREDPSVVEISLFFSSWDL